MTSVTGLDLSLTATGIATAHGVHTVTSKLRGPARLVELRDRIMAHCLTTDVVAIEGYSMGGQRGSAGVGQALGELGGVVRVALWEAGITYVELSPSSLKKYATGKGNANKETMLLAAAKRAADIGVEITNNNEADAFFLRAAVLQALGEQIVAMPAVNVAAVAALAVELGVVAA